MQKSNERTIITIGGPKGCGKSAIGFGILNAISSENFPTIRLPMAEALKRMVSSLLVADAGLSPREAFEHVEGSDKEKPIETLGNVTSRHLMQTLGTEWGRKCIGDSFWVLLFQAKVKFLMQELVESKEFRIKRPQVVVCDDVRFENEVLGAKETADELGIPHYHLYIERQGCEYSNEHESEFGLPIYDLEAQGVNVIDVNNNGPIEGVVYLILEKILPERLRSIQQEQLIETLKDKARVYSN